MTHIYKYDWNTKSKVAETVFSDQVSVIDVYNGLIIARSYNIARHVAIVVLEEDGDTLTVKYKSEPGSFFAEYFRKGSSLYVIDSMSCNTYDIYDFTDIQNIKHNAGARTRFGSLQLKVVLP